MYFLALYFFPLQVLKDCHKKNNISDAQLLACYEMYHQELLNVHLGQGNYFKNEKKII